MIKIIQTRTTGQAGHFGSPGKFKERGHKFVPLHLFKLYALRKLENWKMSVTTIK